MPKVWFTADQHFGHANIIRFCSRPFRDVATMDQVMIEKWNATVAPQDVVYHLGDFSFAPQRSYLRVLNGSKVLIRGNHDKKEQLYAEGWMAIHELLRVNVEGTQVVLCHYAMRAWDLAHHGSLHLFGHSHGKMPANGQSCDVGVDCWDFFPASLKQIKFYLSSQRPRTEP